MLRIGSLCARACAVLVVCGDHPLLSGAASAALDFGRFWVAAGIMSLPSGSKLECDRYGVPQYSGDVEAFEEYTERAWDLYCGREGQDSMQIATPIHLRAGLSGPAYEAVRKLGHEKLRTVTSEGKATTAGLKLLLTTLKDNIAAEVPVKTNELFFTAFYSPHVWRRHQETMQQYIIRSKTL